jgi:hypothetical protein
VGKDRRLHLNLWVVKRSNRVGFCLTYQATLVRRATVSSLFLQLVFPGSTFQELYSRVGFWPLDKTYCEISQITTVKSFITFGPGRSLWRCLDLFRPVKHGVADVTDFECNTRNFGYFCLQ